MKTTIVIPTYNEGENLESLIERIAALHLPTCEVLVVDDASPDGTGELADQLRAQCRDPSSTFSIHTLHRPRKVGLGAAYLAGFRDALARNPEIIVQMDADGSHDPNEIHEMLRLLRGVDLVIGSRLVSGGRTIGWGIHRHLASRGAQWFSRKLLHLRTRDVTSGFRAWRAATLEQVLDDALPVQGYAFQEATLHAAEQRGARIVEHPITFRDRTHGASKLGWGDVTEFLSAIVRMRFRR